MFKYKQIDYFKIVKQLQVPQNIYYIQISPPVSQICLPHYLQSMFYTVRVVAYTTPDQLRKIPELRLYRSNREPLK